MKMINGVYILLLAGKIATGGYRQRHSAKTASFDLCNSVPDIMDDIMYWDFPDHHNSHRVMQCSPPDIFFTGWQTPIFECQRGGVV
jgi:hypothetical protein